MANHDHNALLELYGTPRAVIHARVSIRARSAPPACEQEDPARIGSSIVSLICLKDHNPTSR
ncbi:hypothetical protein [Rhizobium mesosinicum]|uniref:hypothetical protein n=1 Tax=Rhizobium mesosinicum TaxID=335017 RepID=UPI001CB79447|nr:hypothetical protein [Rhizobium mesosinicum]